MKVIRVLRCLGCGKRYKRVQDSTEDPAPCPDCGTAELPPPARIAAPAIVGTKSRAIDEAYRVAEADYGFTNMNDGMKEGDTAFKPPPLPPQTVDPRTLTSPTMLWGGAQTGSAMVQAPTLAQARGAAALANAEGKNPMKLLHSARPKLVATPLNRE